MVVSTQKLSDKEFISKYFDFKTVEKSYMHYNQLLEMYKNLHDIPVTQLALLSRYNTDKLIEVLRQYQEKINSNEILSSPVLETFKVESSKIYNDHLVLGADGQPQRDSNGMPKIKNPESYTMQLDNLKKKLSTEEQSVDDLIQRSNEEFGKISQEVIPTELATLDISKLLERNDITAEMLVFLTQMENFI